ncbi:hypothetical protein [Magnetospira sp. QH-2]|uniref:hypothetical protein n=1 Tax=Magnetospira sp. (strain QH-2) TaxID=1288970 RepID=UPI0003E81248|nr:hypothetical protein [Magnetospira sp. QH-2]CCQ72166.1 hypothetical membrane protein of unknown function [Magnetospira sp. QH-2]
MSANRVMSLGFAGSAVVALAYLAYVLFRYATFGTYFDHAEAETALLSWRLAADGTLYDTPGSLEHTITAYGPLLYMINAAFLGIWGGSIAVSKLAALAACFTASVLFILHACRHHGAALAGLGGLLFICYPLIVTPIGYWTRPDSLLVLLVTLGVIAGSQSDRGRPWLAAFGVAACAGLAVNLKVHAALYFVPIVLRFCLYRPLSVWPMMAVVSLVFALLPFAFPGVSLQHYAEGIADIVSSRPIDMELLRTSVRFSLIFLLPGLALLLPLVTRGPLVSRAEIGYFGALALCVVIGLYPSSVPGAAWYHLLPFYPITVDLFLRLARALDQHRWIGTTAKLVMALTLVIMSYLPQKRFLRSLDGFGWTEDVAAESRSLMKRYEGTPVQVGYSSDNVGGYGRTFILRPMLAFGGFRPYALSAAASMERQYANIALPAAKKAILSQCGKTVWIIPRSDGKPFTMNGFFPGTKAFPTDVSAHFTQAFERMERGTHFDVWGCRTPGLDG